MKIDYIKRKRGKTDSRKLFAITLKTFEFWMNVIQMGAVATTCPDCSTNNFSFVNDLRTLGTPTVNHSTVLTHAKNSKDTLKVECAHCGDSYSLLYKETSPLIDYQPTAIVGSSVIDHYSKLDFYPMTVFVVTHVDGATRSDPFYVVLLAKRERYHYNINAIGGFHYDADGELKDFYPPMELIIDPSGTEIEGIRDFILDLQSNLIKNITVKGAPF